MNHTASWLARRSIEVASLIALPLLIAGCATPFVLDVRMTTCGAEGRIGPEQAACEAAYADTALEGDVTVVEGVQSITIVRTGTYRITAEGAQGASAEPGQAGGRGARARADLALTAGDVLQVVVGQAGSGQDSETNGGGGGGSFVVSDMDDPLVIAGGGGGARVLAARAGCDANTGTFGIEGSGDADTSACEVKASDETLGGSVSSSSWGSAGAGFLGDGDHDGSYGFGGASWANGMTGGDWTGFCRSDPGEGGFGGGGSGSGCDGGGGGGGYSGGDGGHIAGGGGSFVTNEATNVTIVVGTGIGEGDGFVTIEFLGN